MAAKRVERRETGSPGTRTRITLDVAEVSLPTLMAGINAARCWLTDEGDGVYAFHASQTIGDLRDQGDKPASDILVELLNRFAGELEGDDVPERISETWDALVDEYVSRTAKPSPPLTEQERSPE